MLTELKLSNFRIFDDEVTVRFRPITVLIGRNSSGKSTVLKFLLMLQQSTMSTGSRFPVINGDHIKMGTFSDLKNSMTSKASLEFTLAFCTHGDNRSNAVSRIVERYELANKGDPLLVVQSEVPYTGSASGGTITYSLRNTVRTGSPVSVSTPISDDFTFFSDNYTRHLDELRPIVKQLEAQNNSDLKLAEEFQAIIAIIGDFVEKADFGMFLMNELDSASHLPAVRADPARATNKSEVLPDNVGKEGQHAVSHLRRIEAEDTEAYQFLLPHLHSVAGIESIEFEDYWEDSHRAFARNKTTGARVLIADFGFGVGQSLAVMVQGALMPHHTTLMLEQPEAQLHPTAQLELGSFFADLWNKRRVGTIIETHSSNILLRLRRLIARGELSQEDVSVAFFTFDEGNGNMPIVKNLDINEDGSIQAGLPMEFFGADIIEGLELGARI